MGKSKARRNKNAMASPTGLPSVRQMETQGELEEPASAVSQTVLSAVEKLQSVNDEERECGCAMIGGLVSQPQVIPQLLRENVVKIMGPLFLDKCHSVRKNAVGALRNMSVDGRPEDCEEMVAQDIMTPLLALLQQYGNEWRPEKLTNTKMDLQTDIFLNAMHLLWNVCENSDVAVEICTRQRVALNLLPCLRQDIYGTALAVTVGQCLQVITEQNAQILEQIRSEETLQLLRSILQTPHESCHQLLLRTVVTGVLCNTVEGEMLSDVVAVLAEVISQEVQGHLHNVVKKLGTHQVTINGDVNGEKSTSADNNETQLGDLQQELEEIQYLLTAQQMALEITSNLCCNDSDDEDNGWEDVDSDESGKEDGPGDVECMTVESSQVHQGEIKSVFASCEMFSKVLSKSATQSLEIHQHLEKFEEGKHIIKSLKMVQCRSLSCTANMLSIMETEQISLADLHETWTRLSQLAAASHVKVDMDLLEAVTSAMRAVVEKLAATNSPTLQELSQDDLKFLFSLIEGSTVDQVHAHIVRIVSIVGCVLSKQQIPHPLLKDIAQFLLEVAQRSPHLWIVAEALDAIFDVFAEDHLNSVISESDLIGHLKNLTPLLKSKINQQKSKLGEHSVIVSTARTNLRRFIQYKTSKRLQ